MIGEVIFVVWRESVEALLVVGILYAWLNKINCEKKAFAYLWFGVLTGVIFAFLLAWFLTALASSFESDDGRNLFEGLVSLTASVLIVQMVLWMSKNAKNIKAELGEQLSYRVANQNWIGLLILVAIAVGREGSETVIFVHGIAGSALDNGEYFSVILSSISGFVFAVISFFVLQLGGKYISWRYFFGFSGFLLFCLAAALLLKAVDNFLDIEYLLDIGFEPLWDASFILGDSSGFGKLLADFVGYRAMPLVPELSIWLFYWVVLFFLVRRFKN